MPPNGGPVRSGRSTRGGCLPVIRWLAGASPGAKPRCDIDFAVFYLFACAAGSPGKKGDATKSGRPRGFAPSLIMLRTRPAPRALRLNSRLCSLVNRREQLLRSFADFCSSGGRDKRLQSVNLSIRQSVN